MEQGVSRTSRPPRLIAGRYELQADLGHGGMGLVHRAHDRSTGQAVALKLLRDVGNRADAHRAHVEREYHTLLPAAHPPVILVYAYRLDDETPFSTM